MTNPQAHKVAYHLVAPDPRLDADYEYPFCWIDSIRRAVYSADQATRNRIEQATLTPVSEAVWHLSFYLFNSWWTRGSS